MRNVARIHLALLLIVMLALAQAACGGSETAKTSSGESDDDQKAEHAQNVGDGDAEGESAGNEDDEEEKTEEAVPVEVAELELGPIESILRFSTNLEAESQVQVVSQATRFVTELLVEEGDRVRKDQVLLRLQDEEQRAAVAKVTSQLAKAEREYQRQERLFRQDLISEQVFNDATFELEQLRIDLENAERELSYAEVLAPINGTVTERKVNLGDQVQLQQHLFDLVDFDSIVARVFVPEKYLVQLRTGLHARVQSQASGSEGVSGTVMRIAPIVDPRSGTVKVTIDVGGQPGLRPGMYVDVDLVTATHSRAVLVPKRALVYDDDQAFVYRLAEENRVERIFIEPALADKYHVEPLEGLSAGDRIVVAGQAGLKDGALVKLPGAEEEAASETEDTAEDVERASL